MSEELPKYLTAEEFDCVIVKSNKPAQILAFQSKDLGKRHSEGLIDKFQLVNLQNITAETFNHQGGSELNKNFSYPRQYTTLNLFYIKIFSFLLSFGMLRPFEELLGGNFVWFISSIDVYNKPLRSVLKPYRKAAEVIEASDLRKIHSGKLGRE